MHNWRKIDVFYPLPDKNCFYDERTGRYYCMGYKPIPKKYRQFQPYDTQFYTIMPSRYTDREHSHEDYYSIQPVSPIIPLNTESTVIPTQPIAEPEKKKDNTILLLIFGALLVFILMKKR